IPDQNGLVTGRAGTALRGCEAAAIRAEASKPTSTAPYTEDFLSGPSVPERGLTVLGCRQHPVAAWAENRCWPIAADWQSKELLSRDGIPDARRAVSGGCKDTASVSTEFDCLHDTLVATQGRGLGAVPDVPDASGLIVRCRDDAIAGPIESGIC